MKNIHLIPTDKPSKLYKHNELGFKLLAPVEHEIGQYNGSNQNIYITSDEEIKEGDWVIANNVLLAKVITEFTWHFINSKKIILTTDQDLIKDGVQVIDNEFLEWFVKNPSCEEVKIANDLKYFNVDELRERHLKGLPHLYSESIGYKIIIPQEEPKALTKLEIAKNIAAIGIGKEEPKQIKCYCGHTITCDCEPLQETLEETAERLATNRHSRSTSAWYLYKNGIIEGAKWQSERMYSEEDMKSTIEKTVEQCNKMMQESYGLLEIDVDYIFEQFKKK
jgi:Icc-related predicted phosphoesterase